MGWDILGVALAFHPVPTEPAALLEGGGEFEALVCVGAAVLGAPDVGGGFPFFGAAVELAEAAAGHLESTLRTNSLRKISFDEAHCKVELRSADIVAGVGRLDDHGFAFDGPVAGEGEFVALAACWVGCGHGGETVGEVVVDGPWGLVGAHEGCASVLTA